MTLDFDKMLGLASDVVDRAQQQGASVAECSVQDGSSLSAKVRLGEPELVEEAASRAVGLRVMIGQKVAVSYTSDLSAAGIARLVEDAVELAQLSEADPFAGPPDPSLLSTRAQHPNLDLFDPAVDGVDGGEAVRRARAGERAALDFDPRVTNTDGATFSRGSGASALVTSGGFSGVARGTFASLVVNPVVDDEGGKKRSGYYWTSRRHLADLEGEEAVGREAARRTLRKLGARKVESQEVPVIFDPDAARSILGLVAGCISGGAIWRKSSYLVDRLNTQVASELITVVDDPLMPRALGSRAHMPSTANASRSSSGGVGISSTNFVLQAGTRSPEEILRETNRGLYVTNMMGFGFNGVTGDFSRGAAGFWIEDGQLAFPVSEVTISLNLDEILKRIDAVGSDLDLRSSTAAPTIRVSRMTLAGR